jgi:hypothetical protein
VRSTKCDHCRELLINPDPLELDEALDYQASYFWTPLIVVDCRDQAITPKLICYVYVVGVFSKLSSHRQISQTVCLVLLARDRYLSKLWNAQLQTAITAMI